VPKKRYGLRSHGRPVAAAPSIPYLSRMSSARKTLARAIASIYYQYFEYPGWHAVRQQYGVRTKQYKLIHYYEINEWELFDLTRDPEELRSVYTDKKYAPVVAQMKRKLTALRAQYRVPSKDPAPYYPWELPPDYRRPGTPGSTRSSEMLTARMQALHHALRQAHM